MQTAIRFTSDVVRGRRHVYRGWWILAASLLATTAGSGISFWSFGLYIAPLESEFGWSRTEVSLGFSIAVVAGGISAPLIGRWVDTRGPRSAIVTGSILAMITYLLLSTTGNLLQWYIYSALNELSRAMMFFIPFQALIARWFNRRRGLATGIFGTAFSLGGFLVMPIMGFTIDTFGWRSGFVASGVVVAATYVPIGLLLIRNSPEEVGQFIDGDRAPKELASSNSERSGVSLRVALRTLHFWVIVSAMGLYLFGIFGFNVHQVPFFESRGIPRSSAIAIVSLSAGAIVISRLLFSFLADKITRFELAPMGLSLFLMSAMLVPLVIPGTVGISLFLILWVPGRSGGPIVEVMLLTRAFGLRHFATLLGALTVVQTIGHILSPAIAGAIFDSTGTYNYALLMYMGTYFAAFTLFAATLRLSQSSASDGTNARV